MQSNNKVQIDLGAIKNEARQRLSERVGDNAQWFERIANRLITLEPVREEVELLADVLTLCVQYYLGTREKMLGTVIAERGVAISERYALREHERLLCNLTGILYKEMGSHVKAIDWFVRGIGIARRIGSRLGEAGVWANMASSANMMGLYEDAIKFSRRALALVATDGADAAVTVRVVASQILSRAYLVLGRFDEAIVAIRNARSQLPTPKTTLDYVNRVRVHHSHTVISLKLDLLGEAQVAAAAAVDDAKNCVGVDSIVHASVCQAMIAAARGDLVSADSMTSKLLQEYGNESSLLYDLYAARLFVLERGNRTDEANLLRTKFRGEWQKKKMREVIAQLSSIDESARLDTAIDSQAAVRERLEELAIIGELHDDSTGEHAFRVGRLAGLLALRIGMDEHQATCLDIAARLHDIGKITTPPEILTKPGALTAAERDVMKTHTTQGHSILKTRQDPLIDMASEIALHHHEWWDGSGYPNSLKGDAIPKVAQIAALADVFDALSHPRCYKPAWSVEASLAEIGRLSSGGTNQQFNTELARQFIGLIRELYAEHGEGGLDSFLSERSLGSQFFSVRAAAGGSLQADTTSAISIVRS